MIPQGSSNNGVTALGQNQPGGSGGDIFSVTQSIDKGGMRGAGVVAAMVAEIALKNKAINIAEDYYKTNKVEYDYFRTVHMPALASTVTEAFGPNNPAYILDAYAPGSSGIAKAAIIDKQWFEARRRIPKYNTGQARKLDYEMALARVMAVVSGWNLAHRFEENYAESRNIRRFNRKAQVANLGIGFGNIVQRTGAAASSNLATAYDKIGDTIASIGNGYAASRGYNQGRQFARTSFAPRDE